MENGTKNNIKDPKPNNSNNATMAGLFIILFGAVLLLRNLDIDLLPKWIFGWQIILIIIGLVIGVNSNFEKKSSVILIALGSIFLLKEWIDFPVGKLIVPIAAICIGVYLIKRNRAPRDPNFIPPKPQQPFNGDKFDWDKRVQDFTDTSSTDHTTNQSFNDQNTYQNPKYGNSYYADNYLNIESILGTSKKIVLSKDFLGGTMTNILGTTEINLLQADLNRPVVIDVFQLFGSTKIIVPPHWNISTQVSSILSENDDRRVIINHPYDENKRLYITGTSILGNISIKNS